MIKCGRCCGYMEEESCYGAMSGAKMFKCILCGERVDEIIIKNRLNPSLERGPEPLMAGQRSLSPRRHECICGCGVMVKGVYATKDCRKKVSMVSVEGRCVVAPRDESAPEFPSDFHLSENTVGLSEIKI